jgi:hypothetical protein
MTYFYGRRQGNGCEIQFRGLLYAREVLISRTVAHTLFLRITVVSKKNSQMILLVYFTPLISGDNNFTDAGQLVRCHDNEVTL